SLEQADAYQVEQNDAGQRVLVCNVPSVSIRYTARVTNPALWSPLFQEFYVAKLAHQLCYGITAKGDLAKLLWDKTEVIRKRAVARDGTEGRRKLTFLTSILTDRR